MDRTMRWPGLAPDVVREVARRLHDAGDFVRLHAVCKLWRSSHDAAPPLFLTTTTTNQFLPWLLAVPDKDSSTLLRFRCIFSKSSYRAPPSASAKNWVGSAEATAVRYLTFKHGHAILLDPLTGEVTYVPQFPFFIDGQQENHNPKGILYGDGTILLYSVGGDNGETARFRAALLCPGDEKWTFVERTLQYDTPRKHGGFCTAYHNGTILILEDSHWRVVTPGLPVSGDVLVPMPTCNYPSHSSYVLEFRRELLWVSVHAWIKHSYPHGEERPSLSRTFSVLVHALEEDASAPTKMWWVRKHDRSLTEHVFFLGSPNSLAIDASQLGGHGGDVYFVYYNHGKALPNELFGVFRYNLVNGKTEFIELVPQGWDNEKCTWLLPQPDIAPIQKITEMLRPEPKLKKQKTTPITSLTRMSHVFRHYEPCFTVMVCNLPPTVNSCELQLLFSKLCKVSSAEVLYKKTRRAMGIGLLTMSTTHAHPKDALDAFNGLHLGGCRLDVTFVKMGRRSFSVTP